MVDADTNVAPTTGRANFNLAGCADVCMVVGSPVCIAANAAMTVVARPGE